MRKVVIGIIILLILFNLYFISQNTISNFENTFDDLDAFIYINLEEKEDRKKLLLAEFNKLGVPNNKIRKISGVRIAKNGHKGCMQSHILALQMAKLNKWDRVAIFEDDARLNVEPAIFVNMVNKAISNNKWDMIILHGANQEEKESIDKDIYYLKHSTQSTGYIIKSSYYDKLLNLFIHCNDMMSKDGWEIPGSWEGHALDQMWNKLVEKDNWIGFKTNLLKQEGESSINGDQKE
jgi:GR25 family glycosyltransferase involved in LPS biosynthesis